MKNFIAILSFITLSFFASFSFAQNNGCNIKPKFSYSTNGLTVSFENESKGSFNKVKWSFADGSTYNKGNISHTFSKGGVYTFRLEVSNTRKGCFEVFEGKVFVFNTNNATPANEPTIATTTVPTFEPAVSQVIEKNMIGAVSTYPNPTTNFANINFTLSTDSEVQVNVFDMAGRLVANIFEGSLQAGVQTVKFERTANMSNGMYFVKISSANAAVTERVILQ